MEITYRELEAIVTGLYMLNVEREVIGEDLFAESVRQLGVKNILSRDEIVDLVVRLNGDNIADDRNQIMILDALEKEQEPDKVKVIFLTRGREVVFAYYVEAPTYKDARKKITDQLAQNEQVVDHDQIQDDEDFVMVSYELEE